MTIHVQASSNPHLTAIAPAAAAERAEEPKASGLCADVVELGKAIVEAPFWRVDLFSFFYRPIFSQLYQAFRWFSQPDEERTERERQERQQVKVAESRALDRSRERKAYVKQSEARLSEQASREERFLQVMQARKA